ncbi:GNAT family N-acetyltransferase [Halobacteriaceae archaeon GCM10025711]
MVYLVGDDGDGVVGFAQFTWGDACREGYVGDDEALLHSLYVAPDCWREGAGTALLERGVEQLPDRLDRLKLGVLPDNEVGRSFYDDHGFEVVGEDVYEMGAASYDVLVLARDL